MLIEKDTFHFQSSYTGIWHRANCPDEQISGTLYIEDQQIWVELFFNSDISLSDTVESIIGCTSTIDSTGKNIAANIIANELEFITRCNLKNGLRHYKYSVSNIFLYENNFKTENIHSLQVRAAILDKWASEIIAQSFRPIDYTQIPQNHHLIHFVEPQIYTLYWGQEFNVHLNFVSSISFADISRSIDVKSFIQVYFKSQISFHEALAKLNQILFLLYLLTNRIFSLDYIYSDSCNNEFVYKANEQQLSRYIEHYNNIEPFTALGDFSNDEIKVVFQKWDTLYKEYNVAIDLFFEIHTNIYSSATSKIKNYISVIDSFSKNLLGEKGEIDETPKRAKFLLDIINKYNISKQESSQLKSQFLKTSGKELKTRFANLIEIVKKFLPSDLDSDFVTKVVNTRNNITHPKSNSTPCYGPESYNKVASQLNKIIICYILLQLDVKDDIINKFLKYSGIAAGLS